MGWKGGGADTARPIKASLKRKRKLQVKRHSGMATGNEAHKCLLEECKDGDRICYSATAN